MGHFPQDQLLIDNRPGERGGGRPPFLTPPLNQKFYATPKICLKLFSSSKIVDFTTFYRNVLVLGWVPAWEYVHLRYTLRVKI